MMGRVVVMAAWCLTAFGQTDGPAQVTREYVSREFVFRHADTAQQFQQVAGILRVVAEMPQVSVLETAGRLRVRGPAGRMAGAEWLFRQLDRPLERETRAESEGYVLRDVKGEKKMVRVFRLARAANPGRLYALAEMLQRVGATELAHTYSNPPSIVLRGTAHELELGSFLLGELDRSAGEVSSSVGEFRLREQGATRVVRIVPLRRMADEELRRAEAEMRKSADAWVALDATIPVLVVMGWPELLDVGQRKLRESGWMR